MCVRSEDFLSWFSSFIFAGVLGTELRFYQTCVASAFTTELSHQPLIINCLNIRLTGTSYTCHVSPDFGVAFNTLFIPGSIFKFLVFRRKIPNN